MRLRIIMAAAALGLAFVAAGCGDDAASPTATARPPAASAVPRATTTGAATATLPGRTPPPTSATTPPQPGETPSVTPPAGMKFERAPIDAAEILVMESQPVQYAVHVVSGLPSGCHQFDHIDVDRSGTQITIAVINRLPDDPRLACTAIYGQHEANVQLGSDFVPGTRYGVQVNDRALEFVAQ